MPQAGHGLSGTTGPMDGEGKPVAASPIPNTYDRLALLFDWVEKGDGAGDAGNCHRRREESSRCARIRATRSTRPGVHLPAMSYVCTR
jgi:hypothetical protein